MSHERNFRLAMASLPPALRELYIEIKSKLNIIIENPIRETETTLRFLLEKSFEPGSHVVGRLTYKWRLSRLPFHIEWTITRADGQLHGLVFQPAGFFLNKSQTSSVASMTGQIISTRLRLDEELEDTARESRRSLRDSSILSLAGVVAIAKLKRERARRTMETRVLEYLTDKGYGKHDLCKITIAMAQLLAELCNDARTGSEYLALSWDEYAKEKDMKETRPTWADPLTSLTTGTPAEIAASIMTSTPAEVPVSSSTNIPAPADGGGTIKKKRKRNKKKKKAATTIEEPSEASEDEAIEADATAAHDEPLKEEPQEQVNDAPSGQDTELEAIPKYDATVDWASEVPKSPDDISISHGDLPATVQPVPASTISSSSRDHQTEGIMLPASPLIEASGPGDNSLSKEASQPEPALIEGSSTAGLSISRRHVIPAVPDLKFFAKPKRSASGTEEAVATSDTKIELVTTETAPVACEPVVAEKSEAGKDTKPQARSVCQHSALRPQAPEFIPSRLRSHLQSQTSSTLASPEMEPSSSIPMSMTTSATTNTSAGVESTTQAKLMEDAMPREDVNIESNKDLDQPQSTSSLSVGAPMTADDSSSEEEKEEEGQQRFELEQLNRAWPWLDELAPVDIISWRYAKFGVESPEEIVRKHGHLVNHYFPDPWYTDIRPAASQANRIPMDVSAVLMKNKSGFPIATGQFDAANNVWRIFAPSSHPGADVRAMDDHPDYLESAKLLEVQGYEMFYYNVYVAIRLEHKCQLETCKKEIRDTHLMTQVCLGCGPLAPVRYCSMHCLLKDIPNHSKECGSSKFWPPSNLVVDPDISLPPRFNDLIPMIKDISGWESDRRRRIHNVVRFLDGDYALFPEDSLRVVEVNVAEHLGEGIRSRVQRLLNCALLDRRNSSLIAYLYLLIRDALYLQIDERYGELPVVLRLQFCHEWKYDHKSEQGYRYLDSIDSCDCMWLGLDNSPNCNGTDGQKSKCKAGSGLTGPHRMTGLKAHVEQLEREHWILRAWQTQHTRVKDWRERACGKGFNGVKPRKFKDLLPVLGVGFEGHISRDLTVGEWRPRLNLDGAPPKARLVRGQWKQNPATFFWQEPTEDKDVKDSKNVRSETESKDSEEAKKKKEPEADKDNDEEKKPKVVKDTQESKQAEEEK